ncbi:hypothetical protein [Burkholderia sp. LMG 13014]|uniref:TraG/VirB4 family ATPase n=1 Tax=Burkholderia sp. LMG 13014 TaxID=2709306 RepID=UPI0019652928|nr:hypothetical protein [Burkholderia sp. LMG 13014]
MASLFKSEFDDTLKGYADMLRYGSIIAPGIVLGKGGELMASYLLEGRDAESMSGRELDQISKRVNSALKRLKPGWMIHCNAFRFESSGYSDEGFFPDPVTRLIDEERRQQYYAEGLHYEGQVVLTFTWLPPHMLESKAKEFLFERSADMKDAQKDLATQHLTYFRTTMRDIVKELRIELTSLKALLPQRKRSTLVDREVMLDPQAAFFKWCATGIRQQVMIPKYLGGIGLDSIIGSQDLTGGMMPKIGNKFIRVVAIDGLAENTHAGILHVLNTVPVDYRFSTRFIYEAPEVAEKQIEKHGKKWKQQIRGFADQFLNRQNGSINGDAQKMYQDAEEAKALSKSGNVKFGYYTSVIVLYHESADILETITATVVEALRMKHFVARIEDVNVMEAFMGSLPGHGYENIRRPLLHTHNLADLLPTTAAWQGMEENPCKFIRKQYPKKYTSGKVPPLFYSSSEGRTPFRCSLHVSDVGHTLIAGPTGAGKSTLLMFLVSQFFRYPNAKVFVFDKGYSAYVLNQASRGLHYDIMGEGSKLGFCPLAKVDRISERVWAEGWIEAMAVLRNVDMNPARRKEISQKLIMVGKNPVDMRTLHHFVSILSDVELREALAYYTTGAGAGGMLNAQKDTLENSHFTVFEMESLFDQGEEHIVPVLMYLFRCIERGLDGSPVMIVLDEAWLMLKHPLFAERIKVWLKVLRKANASVVFATQEIEDLHASSIRSTIYSACMTKILLPNGSADTVSVREYYRELGLSDRQIFLLTEAIPKQDYYYVSPYGRRMFRLDLGPIALAMTAVAGVESTLQVKEFQLKFGDGWVKEWLIDQGVEGDMLKLYGAYASNQSSYLREKFAA